jgi:hypothetical protein
MNKYKIAIAVLLCAFLGLTFATCNAQIVKTQEWQFDNTVTLGGDVVIPTGATSGYVLTSDVSGNATWQVSGTGAVQIAEVTLSSAQILSLHTTPITLVAAQGANTVIAPIRYITYYDYNSISYTTETTLIVQLGGVTQTTFFSVLSLSSDALFFGNPSNTSQQAPIPQINGDLTITTPTSNPTAGNGTVKIRVLYSVINL